jgi:hypothetical protein
MMGKLLFGNVGGIKTDSDAGLKQAWNTELEPPAKIDNLLDGSRRSS